MTDTYEFEQQPAKKKRVGRTRKSRASAARNVKLRLRHIDFWSAVKVGAVIQLALAIATIVGLFVLWSAATSLGVISAVSQFVNTTLGGGVIDVNQSLSLDVVMTFAVTLSIFNIVLGTILAGIGALIFNLIAKVTGGLLVGFSNN